MVRLNIYFKTILNSAAFVRCNTLWNNIRGLTPTLPAQRGVAQANTELLVADQVDGGMNPRSLISTVTCAC